MHPSDLIEGEHPESYPELPPELLGVTHGDAVTAKCRRTYYPARRTSGRRPLTAVKFIVMHSTEGSTARGAAMWFRNKDSKGSAHLCLDNDVCYRCLPNTAIPWGAKGTNYGGFHIEQAGFARWSSLIWSRQHRRLLRRAAYKTAVHARLFNIPIRFVGAADLRAGRRGITTHNEATKAFGGSHWDPGRGWPRVMFMGLVRMYARQLNKKHG